MASQQQTRKQQATKGHQETDQGQAMNLEEIGKYRAEAQQRSADAIRAAEDRFHKANNQQARGAGARGTVTVAQAPVATVVPYQESVKQAETESHGRGSHGSEAQQWLADAAADARERCNKALGTSPAAAHEGKASAAHATAGAAPHQQTKNEREGGQVHGHLTRQDEMGKHGSEAQKNSTAEAARAAVEKHDKGRETGAAAGQGVKDTAAKHDKYGETGATAGRKSHKDTTGDMARKAADTAVQAKDKMRDTAVSMVQKAGDTAVRAKDTAWDAAGGMAQRSRDTGAQAGDKAEDVTWRAEQEAGELKERASGTVKTGGGASTTKAKGGGDENTTVVGDVLEAVGATVVGLAKHTKGIVAGEEELVPVGGEKGKSPEEKTKLA
ncbi:hypothetical protein Zm00014a_013212 [Zea mays]|uniref:Uncharacterized protein n=1 Tax=Zea mays TaxID=4577 RepID=A0A3L6EG91_MAIZE|nr:hypothetical protein Zm00014a_013212 [Zea mays]